MNERSLTVPGAPVYGKLAAAHRAGEDSSFLVATTRPAPTAKAPAPKRKADDEACEVTAAAALDDKRRAAKALTGPRAAAFATRENMLQIKGGRIVVWKNQTAREENQGTILAHPRKTSIFSRPPKVIFPRQNRTRSTAVHCSTTQHVPEAQYSRHNCTQSRLPRRACSFGEWRREKVVLQLVPLFFPRVTKPARTQHRVSNGQRFQLRFFGESFASSYFD